MTNNINKHSEILKLKDALIKDQAFKDARLPLREHILNLQGQLFNDSDQLEKITASTPVLLQAARFGSLLTAISRFELISRAEAGDLQAKLALQELTGAKVIYPGTFDPFTIGHSDVVRRAARLFGSVVVAIGINPGKTPLFSCEERVQMIQEDLKDLGNAVKVEVFKGSLVAFARQIDCSVILRGVRSVTDYEQELQLAQLNHTLSKYNLETLFIPAKEGASFVSSSIVKAVIKVDEDASSMVSPKVLAALQKKRLEGYL